MNLHTVLSLLAVTLAIGGMSVWGGLWPRAVQPLHGPAPPPPVQLPRVQSQTSAENAQVPTAAPNSRYNPDNFPPYIKRIFDKPQNMRTPREQQTINEYMIPGFREMQMKYERQRASNR